VESRGGARRSGAGTVGRKLIAGERSLVASGRRAARQSRGLAARGESGMRCDAAAHERECGVTRFGRRGQRDMRDASACWADVGLGRIRKHRYAYRNADTYQPNISEFNKRNKKADTSWIRIGAVSDTYPCPMRIRYGIRAFPGVSV
jgi:hypothetical protein